MVNEKENLTLTQKEKILNVLSDMDKFISLKLMEIKKKRRDLND